MPRPTLRDVAQAAGVSHMSVSRVIRGVRLVSPGMVRRVKEAIRQLDYRPDPALSALAAYRSSKSRSDGFVLAFLDCDGTSYSRHVFDGAAGETRLLGYGMERFRLQASAHSQRRLARILFHRGVRGLLFGPSDIAWHFEGWNWEAFAAVSLDALAHVPAHHSVAMDYFEGAVTACRHLREQDCRRIGMVIDPALEKRTGSHWRGGFLASQRTGNHAPLYSDSIHDRRRLTAWARKTRIDAVITIHPEVGLTLRPLGIKVVYLNNACEDGAPHISLDPAEIGAEGVRLLHHLLLRREFGVPARPKAMRLQGRWLDG